MNERLTEEKSIYLQIGEMIETDILRGILLEEEQVPSTNELARLYTINPATAAKGVNILVDEGILYKRRGIGMFVAPGAREKILAKRRSAFAQGHIVPLLAEARSLGITKEELLTQMSDDINELAEHLELSREETIQELKDHYDGYHFCWPSPDVFNPYSLLNCFADGEIDSYWFGTGTPTYLINMMRQYDFLPADLGETIEVDKKDFDAPTETMTTIIPLLYQSGYVTIKGYDKPTKLYQLALPNQEIRVGLYGSLLPHYLTDKSAKANTTIAKMSVLVKKGDMDAAFCLLNDFLETVPYCDNTNYEGHWQQTLYIMFALLTNYSIHVEPHTAKGRIDITMETDDTIYVMELKFNKSAEEALAQIEAKHYADAFKMSGKKVVKIGLNFSVKDEVNCLEWKIG